MENQSERKRKSKGRLSVMDEFTGDAGVIEFKPQISIDEQNRIDKKTKLADIPTYARAELAENLGQTSDKPKTEPRTILGQTQDILRTNSGQILYENNETSDKPKTEPRTNLGQT